MVRMAPLRVVAVVAAVVALGATIGAALDPAEGWVAYAVGESPNSGTTQRLTYFSAFWRVPQNPEGECFQSPWIGAGAGHTSGSGEFLGENLLQPVNPWTGPGGWQAYDEYFQWNPEYNRNSEAFSVSSGDLMHGEISFLGEQVQAYNVTQTNANTGQSTSFTIKVQKEASGEYKVYTHIWIVYEKVCSRCAEYPPDNKVSFTDIQAVWNGQILAPKFSTGSVDHVCNFQAKPVNASVVDITWNSQSQEPIPAELVNGHVRHLHADANIEDVVV